MSKKDESEDYTVERSVNLLAGNGEFKFTWGENFDPRFETLRCSDNEVLIVTLPAEALLVLIDAMEDAVGMIKYPMCPEDPPF